MTKTSLRTAFLFAFLFGCVSSTSALSPIVYVDASYTEKNADNRTFGVDAFSTIQKGIDAVEEDGIVYVKKGMYPEALTITKSVSLSGFTEHVISGASDNAPTIDGKDATATILVQGSSTPLRVSVFNFHITNGNHGVLIIQKAKVNISNNESSFFVILPLKYYW